MRFGEAFVEAVRRAPVRFIDNPCDLASVTFNDVSASIGRAWVDHDVFQTGVILLDN